MADPVISTAIKMLEKITEEDELTIRFRKRSTGEMRVMKCTLNFEKIPTRDKPASVNLKSILKLLRDHKILHVYDLEKMGWRSIPVDATEWMQTPKQRYMIRID